MPRIQLRENFGAIVQVEIRLPPDLSQEKQVLGIYSGLVAGEALIDTGADVTAFDLKAAERAGLVRSGTGSLSTVLGHHDSETPLFLGEIEIAGFGAFTVPSGRGFDLSHLDYVAVIGRDILRHGILVYNGREGWATLSRNGGQTEAPSV